MGQEYNACMTLPSPTALIVIVCSFPDESTAQKCLDDLLQKHLVACGQIEKVASSYIWKDELCHEDEYKLSLKTAAHLYTKIETEILKTHPYDTPMVLALPVIAVNETYKKWVLESVDNKTL